MGLFSDILLTVDFDRTLTAPDTTVPQRNIDAIRYFMAEGGVFTVNTGRSVPMIRKFLDIIPVNAPYLLYNGSAAYDAATGELSLCRPIERDMWQMLDAVAEAFPDMNIELQAVDAHYSYGFRPDWNRFYARIGCAYGQLDREKDYGTFLKFALIGKLNKDNVANLYEDDPVITARADAAEQWLKDTFADSVTVLRSGAKIVDVQARGVSKIDAAKALQQKLGRKILVCVGDARNDIAMLDGADYAFCPADGVIADRYPNVCNCAQGAVADVIYKKIPEIPGL